jgi:hypothetical protein
MGQGDEQLGHVIGESEVAGHRLAGVEVNQPRLVALIHHHTPTSEVVVGDAVGVQQTDLPHSSANNWSSSCMTTHISGYSTPGRSLTSRKTSISSSSMWLRLTSLIDHEQHREPVDKSDDVTRVPGQERVGSGRV